MKPLLLQFFLDSGLLRGELCLRIFRLLLVDFNGSGRNKSWLLFHCDQGRGIDRIHEDLQIGVAAGNVR